MVNPLVLKGKEIHNEILGKIKNTDEWESLSYEDKDLIINFTDDSYATLALVYSYTANANSSLAKPNPQIMSCIGVALGVVP